MTSTNDDTKPPGGDDHGHGDDGPTMADVRKLVAEEIGNALEPFKKLLGGGGDNSGDKPPAAPDNQGGGDIDGMVERAISKVLGDKDKKDADDQHQREHDRLKEATAERPPIDRPTRARWLGKIYDNN